MTRGQKRWASKKEPANLKRFKSMVQSYTKEHDERHGDHPESSPSKGQGTLSLKLQSRKEKRKEARLLKKARRHAFKQSRTLPTAESLGQERKAEEEKIRKQEQKRKKRRQQRKRKAARKSKEVQEESDSEAEDLDTRKQGFLEANAVEDKTIKQLERHLKMNKRKRKNLPQAFVNDGLDFILDAVDSEKLQSGSAKEGKTDVFGIGFSDTDSDDLEDSDNVVPADSGDEDSDDEMGSVDDYPQESLSGSESDESQKDAHKKKASKRKGEVEKQKKVHFKSDSDLQEQIMEPSPSGKNCHELSKMAASHDEDDHDDGDETDLDDDDDDDGDNEDVDGDEDDGDSHKAQTKFSSTKYKEDIYGRLRDDEGNVVVETGGSYIPPAKRLALAGPQGKKKIELERMKKQLKGLVNRLSEANIQPISTQIEGLFQSHSRAELSEALAETIQAVCIAPSLTPDRLVMEHAMLIAILHGNVGSEVGALFLQTLAKQFTMLSELPSYGLGKEMDNLLALLSHMYNFKIVHGSLIFDICHKLTNRFEERDIELLLLVLRSVGFSLRKDDPNALRELIITIQERAGSVNTSTFQDQSRVKFMLEVLLAIRNNNMRKIPNYDPSHCDHLKKLLRNYVRGSIVENQLRISLEDLVSAEDKGRWWLIGSAWTGHNRGSSITTPKSQAVVHEASDKILELARKQRMNTDIRKNIFCILMTSEDFVDAFEKLLRLGLKHQQEREIIHVILDTCLHEKVFNPYYAYLAQKFSEYNRRFTMTLQFSLWDRFKELQVLSDSQIANLARLLTHLIAMKALSLSVFKVIEFGELDKAKVKLMRKVLMGLLGEYEDYIVKEVFMRISAIPKLNMLREGLKLFIQHFLVRNKGKVVQLSKDLRQKVRVAEQALSSAESTMWL